MSAAVEFLVKGLYPVRFTDADLVNPEAYDQNDAGKPHRPGAEKLWLIHEHGMCVCLVFASCEQDALDIACDEDKLDKFMLTEEEIKQENEDGEEVGVTRLGNAGEPFDLESVEIVQLPVPKLSITALLLAGGHVTEPKQYNTLPR